MVGVVSSEGAGAVGRGKMEAAGGMKGMVRGKSLQAEEAARLSRNSKAFLRAKVRFHCRSFASSFSFAGVGLQ